MWRLLSTELCNYMTVIKVIDVEGRIVYKPKHQLLENQLPIRSCDESSTLPISTMINVRVAIFMSMGILAAYAASTCIVNSPKALKSPKFCLGIGKPVSTSRLTSPFEPCRRLQDLKFACLFSVPSVEISVLPSQFQRWHYKPEAAALLPVWRRNLPGAR